MQPLTTTAKIALTAGGLILLLAFWYWSKRNDYFIAKYNDLSSEELAEFKKDPDPTLIYRSNIGKEKYQFPRQHVNQVKLFQNTPLLGSLNSRTLKEEFNQEVTTFFNDSTNFSWSETTWSIQDADYILKFYNNGKLVGKVWLCLTGCGMISTHPFTPNTKFGGLTIEGKRILESILNDHTKWE